MGRGGRGVAVWCLREPSVRRDLISFVVGHAVAMSHPQVCGVRTTRALVPPSRRHTHPTPSTPPHPHHHTHTTTPTTPTPPHQHHHTHAHPRQIPFQVARSAPGVTATMPHRTPMPVSAITRLTPTGLKAGVEGGGAAGSAGGGAGGGGPMSLPQHNLAP